MPGDLLCEGPPGQRCPNKAKGKLSQGDMMLCKKCENVRFPNSKEILNVTENLFEDFIATAKYEHIQLIESMSISQLKRLDRDAIYDQLHIKLLSTFPHCTPDVQKLRLCSNAANEIDDAAKLQLAKKESLRAVPTVQKAKKLLESFVTPASQVADSILAGINRRIHGQPKRVSFSKAGDGSYIANDTSIGSLKPQQSPSSSISCIPETQLNLTDHSSLSQSIHTPPSIHTAPSANVNVYETVPIQPEQVLVAQIKSK